MALLCPSLLAGFEGPPAPPVATFDLDGMAVRLNVG
jgi:hypothetical protein